MIQLNPPIPMISPKGKCWAHFLINDGPEHDLYWTVFQDDSGECWTWNNKDIRAQKNLTLGRENISPFYEPWKVSLEKEKPNARPKR